MHSRPFGTLGFEEGVICAPTIHCSILSPPSRVYFRQGGGSVRRITFCDPSILAAMSTFMIKTVLGLCILTLLPLVQQASAAVISAPSLGAIPASMLTQMTNFGSNPSNVGMFVYKPARVAAKPALIVASHCAWSLVAAGFVPKA